MPCQERDFLYYNIIPWGLKLEFHCHSLTQTDAPTIHNNILKSIAKNWIAVCMFSINQMIYLATSFFSSCSVCIFPLHWKISVTFTYFNASPSFHSPCFLPFTYLCLSLPLLLPVNAMPHIPAVYYVILSTKDGVSLWKVGQCQEVLCLMRTFAITFKPTFCIFHLEDKNKKNGRTLICFSTFHGLPLRACVQNSTFIYTVWWKFWFWPVLAVFFLMVEAKY